MSHSISRRQFSSSLLAASGATLLGAAGGSLLGGARAVAAPPGSSEPKVPKDPMPPVTVNIVPEAFEDRYADLGGVLDLSNGVIWGYEPAASLVNITTTFMQGLVNDFYLGVLAEREANAPTVEEEAIFAEALAIASQRTWRWPTVFEAREAVEKGLFTFGEGGLNAYYGSPVYPAPGVSYGLNNLRWSSSVIPKGTVHAWRAGDGGTMLVTKTSALGGIVVSKL